MKISIKIIFVVLLLFLFVGATAYAGPTPPDIRRISDDPFDDDPWGEESSNTEPSISPLEESNYNTVESNKIKSTNGKYGIEGYKRMELPIEVDIIIIFNIVIII